VSEPSPPAGGDTNYILSQQEFHDTIAASELRGSLRTESFIRRELDEAETAFGWVLLSLAFFLFLLGYYALKGELRA
jgi:hypothetical protein